MKHYIFATINKNTGEIINCWEQPTMPEGVNVPIENINPNPDWEIVQIDADEDINILKFNAMSEKQAFSEWILKNKKVDKISLKVKDKIKIGGLINLL